MTPPLISRRLFLAGAAGAVVAACSDDGTSDPTATSTTATPATSSTTTSTTTTLAPVELPGDPFTLGVASGDPDASSVVLWTRLAPVPLEGGGMPADDVPVLWEASATDDFAAVAASGTEIATAHDGHCVHAIATLAPGKWFYRFRVGQYTSAVGVTQIAPSDSVAQVRFATGSCQHYEAGHYAAHRDIAEQAPDFMVWLGDYIYEGAGAANADPAQRVHLGPEPTTVEEYRNRYARYKSDPNLQAAHAACPWFVVWDDHEVENNYASLIPQVANDAAAFAERRLAAYRAWWEHQPVRLPAPIGPDSEYRIYRQSTWGDLINLALLDGRQYRSDQACNDAVLSLEPACAEALDPSRTMLGDAQEAWLLDALTSSSAHWNVIGNQVVMANATLNDAILNYDQWDGYPAARQRLLGGVQAAGVANLMVLTGDIHLGAVGYLSHEGERVGVEFVTTSISSSGNIPADFQDVLKDFPDFVDAELAHRGYTFHTVTPDEWVAELRIVADVASPTSEVTTYARYAIASGSTTAVAT